MSLEEKFANKTATIEDFDIVVKNILKDNDSVYWIFKYTNCPYFQTIKQQYQKSRESKPRFKSGDKLFKKNNPKVQIQIIKVLEHHYNYKLISENNNKVYQLDINNINEKWILLV